MTVWIVLWNHRYGTDSMVAGSKEAAYKLLANTVLESAGDELPRKDEDKLRDYVRTENYTGAIDFYFNTGKTVDETYEIEERLVIDT